MQITQNMFKRLMKTNTEEIVKNFISNNKYQVKIKEYD